LVLSSIKTIRSFGGRFFIISQTIPGLDDIYGESGRRSLQGGAGVQIYMTPQDDRTAEVLSNALGRSTITAVTESQSRIRALDDSANVSRRSEERPLISANELLRFPLDEVLVLPEGQYPIRARHIRYYEDRHFAPIDRARAGRSVVNLAQANRQTSGNVAVKLSNLVVAVVASNIAERLPEATAGFQELARAAKGKRRLPERAAAGIET
jgi:type IV secretion system protein VirD4